METKNRMAEALAEDRFVITVEMIPGRGAVEQSQEDILDESEKIYALGNIDAISITDNPGGNPALLAEGFGLAMLQRGITPLIHFTCKDRNRNQAAAQLYSMQRHGIENILTMTGDFQVSGWEGQSRPVFDVDSVQILQMVDAINKGEKFENRGQVAQLMPMNFNQGAVTSPFKWTEGETMPQYYKLQKKIKCGAKYVISQLGYEPRKMQELIWYVRDQGFDTPIIGNIYILNKGVGRTMNAGNIPGAHVSDSFLEHLIAEGEAEDKGKEARLTRGAAMIAMCKGMGYNGVHIGGLNVDHKTVKWMLEKAEEMLPEWEKYATELQKQYATDYNGFYYYKEDPETLLNVREPAPRTELRTDSAIRGNYGLSRFVHKLMFREGKGIYPIFAGIMKWRERSKGLYRSHKIEHLGKVLLYDCMDCGDCGLMGCAYVCPMVHCAKSQRNGPCGGTALGGWCEVYPNVRYCIYYIAYNRLKKHGEEEALNDYITPPNRWQYKETSAWCNYIYGRDNTARRLRVTPYRDGESIDPRIAYQGTDYEGKLPKPRMTEVDDEDRVFESF